MNRNLILTLVIGLMILIMIAYNSSEHEGGLQMQNRIRLHPLSQEQQEWLDEKGTLVIGITDNSAPFVLWDDGMQPKGFLIDYMEFIAREYDVSILYEPILMNEILSKLDSQEVDAVISTPDVSYEEELEFTMPIMKTKGILLFQNTITNRESREGKDMRIILVEGSPWKRVLENRFPKATYLPVENMKEAAAAAASRQGNAIAGSETALQHFMGAEQMEQNWSRASGYLYEKNDCLAVDSENTMLYEILNNAVYYLDNTKVVSELQSKWLGLSYSLKSENRLEGAGIIILIVFAAVLCIFSLFYQSNKSLYEELQQRMELLIESQNEMQTTFDGVTYYLAEINRDGLVVSINKAFSQFLQMKRHKAVGLPLISLFTMDEKEKQKLSQLISETFKDESEKSDEISIGKKILEIHTFLIKDNKEKVQKILTMMVDVTEARSTERQMLQNHKMIAVGQLATGVAHEIRNPLGLIRNYCYVLKEIDYRDYINRDEAIKVIEKSVDKSSRIIDNLLNFSRITTNKKEIVNLNVHLSAILDLQRNLLVKHKIDLKYEYLGSDTVTINIEAIEIILINLITNAVDAISQPGKITVHCVEDGHNIILSVNDTGQGIEPDIIDEIFNPFFTTKKKREGNGLGLYIVYNEVQKMGGEIKVESEVGIGTTFTIRIPIEKEEQYQ
ncbi:ATP-binding protein [Sinanaerobacter chloroacetimidivorans]|uniref:histidine kinase n=1 Tax=Sinanaerobacter chloroacetimidivorans TaxID=2818044 RepID=A0A8J7VZN3_9FIRM|nr:ATP-binding protein [Sinanaerobacter chloroacetimidivorans]MBR0598092.1 transporter substrate-binding domain-containing protein [Sinanaerobacter chloroacetimidivorans]